MRLTKRQTCSPVRFARATKPALRVTSGAGAQHHERARVVTSATSRARTLSTQRQSRQARARESRHRQYRRTCCALGCRTTPSQAWGTASLCHAMGTRHSRLRADVVTRMYTSEVRQPHAPRVEYREQYRMRSSMSNWKHECVIARLLRLGAPAAVLGLPTVDHPPRAPIRSWHDLPAPAGASTMNATNAWRLALGPRCAPFSNLTYTGLAHGPARFLQHTGLSARSRAGTGTWFTHWVFVVLSL